MNKNSWLDSWARHYTNSRNKQITERERVSEKNWIFVFLSLTWHFRLLVYTIQNCRMQYNCGKQSKSETLSLEIRKSVSTEQVVFSLKLFFPLCYLLAWSNPISRFKFSVILVPTAVSVANDEYVIFWRRYISAMVCINRWQVCWPPTL